MRAGEGEQELHDAGFQDRRICTRQRKGIGGRPPIGGVPLLAVLLTMTHNPVWIESTATGLRACFMPEDDRSTFYVFEVDTREP
jgi:hypothetical protein